MITMILLIVAAVGYAAELFVGLPGFLLLKRVGWLSSISVLVGATFVGVMVAFLLDLPHLNLARCHYYTTCAGAGASSGVLFAAIGRPVLEKTAPVRVGAGEGQTR